MDLTKILFKTNSFDVEKALPDGVVFCTNDLKIQWVNDKAAEIFETSKMNLKTSVVSDFIENANNLIMNAILNNKSVITKMTGREVYFEMTARQIEEGYVLAFRDIEAGVNYRQERTSTNGASADKNKNEFLLKLVNDFKAPLQSIIGFSQAMADGLGGNMTDQQEKYIKIIKKNSSDLMYFTDKLFELSRTELESIPPESKTFDIVNLINSLVRYNEQLCKDKDIHWNVSVAEGLKNTILSNENYIKNILQNIFEVIFRSVEVGDINVGLSMPEEEFLRSKNIPAGGYIMLSVTGTSLMLSKSDLEQIFEPYELIDSPNRKNLIRAITLASVKNMVRALRGFIWVESKVLKNTTFNIVIPHN